MTCFLLTLAATAQDGPLERNARFMESVTGLTLEFTASTPFMPSKGSGKLVMRLPDMQVYSCTWGTERFRYSHSKAGSLAVRDDWKEYMEGEPFLRNVQPNGDVSGQGPEFAYPNFLLYGALKNFDKDAKRETLGQDTVRGETCDKVHIVSMARGTAGDHVFWVDSKGRVLKWDRSLDTQGGVVNISIEFTKIETSAPTDAAFYTPKLPIGYMPMSVPGPKTRTRMVSEPAVFGTWTDARTDKQTDVVKLVKGKPVAIVFTDPDCPICATIEPYLVSLRRSLKLKECALIEISLGPKKPDFSKKDKDRMVFWDQSGDIERAYGTPGTPYFLLADKTGLLVRGWQGYEKAMEKDITKNLLSAFDKD